MGFCRGNASTHSDVAASLGFGNSKSDQPQSGLAPDDVPNDIQGWILNTADEDLQGQLRAERYGSDRIYTLTYQGKDKVGNTTTREATVRVPKGG